RFAAMLIVCPNCATSYRVEPSSLGATGRSVRCVRCRNVWFAHDPSALTAIADAHRTEVSTLARPDSGNEVPASAEPPPSSQDDIAAVDIAATEESTGANQPSLAQSEGDEQLADPSPGAEGREQPPLPEAPEPSAIPAAPL